MSIRDLHTLADAAATYRLRERQAEGVAAGDAFMRGAASPGGSLSTSLPAPHRLWLSSREALAHASGICREFYRAEGPYGERWCDDWNRLWGGRGPATERGQ